MLTEDVVLLHNNPWPHTALCTKMLLEQLKWKIYNHLPYSLDLALSDYHLFTKTGSWLAIITLAKNAKVRESV